MFNAERRDDIGVGGRVLRSRGAAAVGDSRSHSVVTSPVAAAFATFERV
jgi:hypothetical protein